MNDDRMITHRFKPEATNGGHYFADCSCGWTGGVYRSRAAAKLAHAAHRDGTPPPPPVRPAVLLAPHDRVK